ncbi:type II toxin-antitoxin system RelE/ParE family toxin [Bacillus sp. EB106-08-02-XG196]|uniref:type II toxin-antitoxin system RelE/ParE family toxin n=1 Tax=Bacillus sp. EB106-08-02-XG196 TaxID=2737049 RepID=UPI0015C45763|nr:type II toxin-antitoxin system RelE/ParE family toxin [Bacillus sp. EB106-08-02-XG196]NWQ42309.1 type II toxin-antitoxin system RelE/ParE family toxin [Bacillus sp. EB106-08-02-XG196]
MGIRNVIWTPAVREKLIEFSSSRFTLEETLDFISQLVLETEDLLTNPLIGKAYTEEFGKYKGISRIVIKKFQIYFKQVKNDLVIIAILFPGENK